MSGSLDLVTAAPRFGIVMAIFALISIYAVRSRGRPNAQEQTSSDEATARACGTCKESREKNHDVESAKCNQSDHPATAGATM